VNIPISHQEYLKDDAKAFAVLATVMEDGSPQATPVWFNWDGENVYINTAEGRVKDRNMRERAHVALAILDPMNPYRYIHLRGTAEELTEEDAREHINVLSKKYTGNPNYQGNPGEVRVLYRLQVEHANAYG
jgi:PPOX class probable F420-dependent enzyme